MKTKKFDAVAWMRRRRAEIDREDEGLSWEERSRKTRDSLKGDPLWERLKGRRVKAATGIGLPAVATVGKKNPRH